ncbi:MAG: MBL fold metallo-hydrolase [Rhodospirillaceae bacterium]|jgi:L-ascorbate metabolism protein UlaG (beta-lactamase superfamily)|nr:MBL fold metallo-hydrolase [Rhodospirillaceae bacterium]
MKKLCVAAVAAVIVTGAYGAPAFSANVKITPLGSHDGEFCARDRAFVMEDPNGTRILFDAGMTIAGADDPRLGKIDVVLVSSVHGDHVGIKHIPAVGAGKCGKPGISVPAMPETLSVKIAAKKGAKLVAGGHMRAFFKTRLKWAGGDPKQMDILRFGGKRTYNGVRIATIPTIHANGASTAFLKGDLGKMMKENGLTAIAGPDSGFIINFTNGLIVYLSADTGHTSDMDTLVRRYYKANLAIMNIGDIFTMGPEEAAWAVNELIRPRAAIMTHANQESTVGGKVVPGTKTETFIKAVRAIPVHVPLSGRTMEFDGNARCLAGCN